MEEVWKVIENTSGRYSVSSHGNVYDHVLDKDVPRMLNGGYMTVNINYTNKRMLDKVHRLVAEMFCEKPNRAFYVKHKNENRLENHYKNLEWMEPLLHGQGYNQPRKEECRNRKAEVSWKCMIQRCYSLISPAFKDYGGRGVIICDEWKDFRKFEDWYAEQENCFPLDTWLELDKDILIKGNVIYSSEFCRLVPREVNQLFKRDVGMSPKRRKSITKALFNWFEYLDDGVIENMIASVE